MTEIDNEINRIKDIFEERVKLSFQMEASFMQIVRYLLVNGADAEAFLRSFIAEELPPDGVVCKNDAKELLEKFRKRAVDETEVGAKEKSPEKKDDKARIAWVEEDVYDHPRTAELLNRAGEIRKIKHYKDVFNAPGHDFKAEKRSGSFIIAKNRDALVYPGAPFCQSFGNEHFYYASCVKNCIYDCDYCFLQGLYPCGYPVYFVNLEDYFAELDGLLRQFHVYLCISYDTDLLAMEPVLHYAEKWTEYASKRDGLKIEIRTKSGNAAVFEKLAEFNKNARGEKNSNVIFAWTVSPTEVTEFAERGLPPLEKRLEALKAARAAGFPVRLCFDPMIYHKEWKRSYKILFEKVFSYVNPEDILDVSVGVFRISNKLLRRMRDANPNSPVTQFPYVTDNGACHYGELSEEMMDFAVCELEKYMDREKIFAWRE